MIWLRRLMRASYRQLLKFYPAPFQAEFAAEMLALFDELTAEAAQQSRGALFVCYLKEFSGAAAGVTHEQLSSLRTAPAPLGRVGVALTALMIVVLGYLAFVALMIDFMVVTTQQRLSLLLLIGATVAQVDRVMAGYTRKPQLAGSIGPQQTISYRHTDAAWGDADVVAVWLDETERVSRVTMMLD